MTSEEETRPNPLWCGCAECTPISVTDIDALEDAERRGAVKALRIEAMRGLDAAEKALGRPGPFRDFAHQMMKGLAQELARRADAIESGEVTL